MDHEMPSSSSPSPASSPVRKSKHEEAAEDGVPIRESSSSHYVFTIALCFVYFANGFMDSIRTSTLHDVAERTDSTFADASFGLLILSAAYCLSTINWSCLFYLLNRQVILMICLILSSCFTLIVPNINQIVHYWIIMGITGFLFAGIDIAVNTWLIEMWTKESNMFLQSMYFAYSIGYVTASLTASPFVASDFHEHVKNGSHMRERQLIHGSDSLLEVPFTIAALIGFTASLVMMYMFFSYKYPYIERRMIKEEMRKNRPNNRNTAAISFISNDAKSRAISVANYRLSVIPQRIPLSKESSSVSGRMTHFLEPSESNNNLSIVSERSSYIDSNQNTIVTTTTPADRESSFDHVLLRRDRSRIQSEERVKKWYKYFIVFMASCFLLSCSLLESNISIFLPDYVMSGSLKSSRSTAVTMTSLIPSIITCVRGMSIMISMKFTSKLMLLVDMLLMIPGVIIFAIFGQQFEIAVWCSIGLIAVGLASVIPATIAFLAERISVGTGTICSLMGASRVTTIFLVYFMSPAVTVNPVAVEVVGVIAVIWGCLFFITMIASDYCCFPKLLDQEEDDEVEKMRQARSASDPQVMQSRYSQDVTLTRL